MAHQSEGVRSNEINFLQEQNNHILAALERVEAERDLAHEQIAACEAKDAGLQSEVASVKDKIDALGARLQQDRSETVAKDEHVRVLSEQNKQMLGLLETEENKAKEHAERIRVLEAKNRKLQKIAEEFDVAKADLEKQVSEAKSKCAEIVAVVRGQRNLNENLRANIQNTEAKTRVDIEALGQALEVVDKKNLEYIQRINKQETREQQLQSETNALKEELETVRGDIDHLRKELEGDEEGRTNFERARSQMEMQIEALEVQADTLKKALSTAERANEQLQEENRTTADRCRETADKVYALMDSLRLNQVELKKQEAENHARDKKLISLERQTQNLQAKISMEMDAKVLAEQERKEAEQEASILKKKNKKIEEAVTLSQQAQEKAEKDISEMNEQVSQLQTQNAYLASRIDGQEEEKNALKADIRKVADRATYLTSENSRLRDEIDQLEEQVATAVSDKDTYEKELAYIKREDVLDEAGRQRPILIQSTESDLIEKLQINEFLYEAQQARNPVPPVIEKIAQLLAMLHEGQGRADQYLADLSKSNGLVSALRQRNMGLFSRTQMFESFKTRALLRYVMNLIEGELVTDLHLDGLSFGPRELNEMVGIMQRYEATEKVYVISLVDNGLDESSVNLLLQLVFSLPYLRSLDLKRNCLGPDSIRKLEEQLRTMEGVTSIIKSANQVINVHSGNQLRLTVDVSEQMEKDQVAKEVDFSVQQDLSHQDADPFIASAAGGTSGHPWTKSAAGANATAAATASALAGTQRSPVTGPVPDASTVDLQKPSAAPAPPVVGGPPVGLGGPGNVAALNKKGKSQDRLPDPKKRAAGRKKSAPPEALDYQVPSQRALDKCGSASSVLMRPRSSSLRSGSHRSESTRGSDVSDWEASPQHAASAEQRRFGREQQQVASVDRSSSMPTLRKATRSGRPPRM